MNCANTRPTLINSVQRALWLLEEVGESPNEVPAKALARRTGIPLSTTYHLLRTLVHEGYVAKGEKGGFLVAEKVESVYSASREQAINRDLRKLLSELHEQLHTATYFGQYRNGEIELTQVMDSPAIPRVNMWVDFREAGHAATLGKALLSELSEEQRAEHFRRHPPVDLTPRTQTGVHQSKWRRAEGTSVVDAEEYTLGTACAATRIPGTDPPAAVAISFPAHRLNRPDTHSSLMARTAERIGRVLALTPH